ncbi:hypothetical protein F5Y08DRAFT_178086 [Xylaria arbuscula]|nr:hypothetical protein F5Y08DRAFT_178086 [Xylaria arbuscula]
MAPRQSTAQMPQRTAPKLAPEVEVEAERAKPKPKPKMTNDEKIHALRQAAKRQARLIEQPAYLDCLHSILFPKKRPAYPAHDDGSISKRRRFVHKPKIEVSRRRSRPRRTQLPSRSPSISISPSPPSSPAPTSSSSSSSSSSSRSSRPTGKSPAKPPPACNKFMELPTEIHIEILRHLLVWPHEITVFRGWSLVYPRLRPQLQVSILFTCRLLRDRGLPILFGENTFAYDLRDPKASHNHTSTVIDKVFDGCEVPINKYGHLIRYIRIKAHSNRLHSNNHRRAFESAILKFLPGGDLAHPANLHTITLEVPAICSEDLEPDAELLEPKLVPICQYLKEDSRINKALFEIRSQYVRVLAWDKFRECWETNIDLLYYFYERELRLQHMTREKGKNYSAAVTADNQNVSGDLDEAASYRPKDVKAMDKRWAKKVEDGVSGLKNLAWRIERLAIDPDLVVDKLKVWRRATNPDNSRDARRSASGELVSLPSNFREPAVRWRSETSSNRCRTASGQSKPATIPGPKLPAKPKAKSKDNSKREVKGKTKAGAKTKSNITHSSILHTGNGVNEAKLLEAQRGTPKKGKGRHVSGMLTKEALEDEDMEDYTDNDDDDDKVTVYWDDGGEGNAGF